MAITQRLVKGSPLTFAELDENFTVVRDYADQAQAWAIAAQDVAQDGPTAAQNALLDESTLFADFVRGQYRLYGGLTSGIDQTKTFSDLFSFARASAATGFDASGFLASSTSGAARFSHKPDGSVNGLIIEPSATNLATYSEDLTKASWIKVLTTISANATVAPDDAATADKVVESASTGEHYTEVQLTRDANLPVSVSFFVKPSGRNNIAFRVYDWLATGSNFGVRYDISTGSVFSLFQSGSATLTSYTFEPLPGGWAKITISGTPGASTGGTIRVRAQIYNPGTSYTGDGTSGFYLWGLQVEPTPTSYIPTTASSASRLADDCTRTLGDEFREESGTIFVTATVKTGETVLTFGSDSIVSDSDQRKAYAMTYTNSDATEIELGNGVFERIALIPRALSGPELLNLTGGPL